MSATVLVTEKMKRTVRDLNTLNYLQLAAVLAVIARERGYLGIEIITEHEKLSEIEGRPVTWNTQITPQEAGFSFTDFNHSLFLEWPDGLNQV